MQNKVLKFYLKVCLVQVLNFKRLSSILIAKSHQSPIDIFINLSLSSSFDYINDLRKVLPLLNISQYKIEIKVLELTRHIQVLQKHLREYLILIFHLMN